MSPYRANKFGQDVDRVVVATDVELHVRLRGQARWIFGQFVHNS